MNAKAVAVAVVAVVALAVPASASAEPHQPIPEERAADFLDSAGAYWERMLPGRRPPCRSAVRFMSDSQWVELAARHRFAPNAEAAADVWGCRIWVKREFWYREPPSDTRLRSLCNTIAHEYGHNLGVGHTPNYPIMVHADYTAECRVAAGEDAAARPNPHLPRTERLYRRGAALTDRLDRLRARARCRCRRLIGRLTRVQRAIRKLEAAQPNRSRFRGASRWP